MKIAIAFNPPRPPCIFRTCAQPTALDHRVQGLAVGKQHVEAGPAWQNPYMFPTGRGLLKTQAPSMTFLARWFAAQGVFNMAHRCNIRHLWMAPAGGGFYFNHRPPGMPSIQRPHHAHAFDHAF